MSDTAPSAPELPGKHTGRYDMAAEEEKPAESEPETEASATPAEQSAPPKIQLIESTRHLRGTPSFAIDPKPEPDDEELDELNEHWNEPGDPDGVFEAEEQQRWQAEHPQPAAVAPRKKRHPFLKALLILVLLAAATAGAWWIGNHEASAPSTKLPAPTQSTKKAPATSQKPASPTTHYDSTRFGIGVDYPTTWKLTDTNDKLLIASPSTQLTTASGSKVQGHVLVTVQNKQSSIPGFPSGGAVSALESQKITYKQPTPIQRAQSYVSFLSYTQITSLDAVYVTGDSGYLQNQLVPMSDVVQGNPLVSVTFVTCATSDCASGTPTPLTLQTSSWQTASFNQPVMNLLESIELEQ